MERVAVVTLSLYAIPPISSMALSAPSRSLPLADLVLVAERDAAPYFCTMTVVPESITYTN